jgi:RNA polymerase sigma factor (TIGR02999 family)
MAADLDDPTRDAPPTAGDITQWLATTGPDAAEAGERLFTLLYDELRRLARGQMRHEAPGHTLTATALAHEAWFRMAAQNRTQWKSRGHFMAVCATMMRRILVNHEMARRAAKRDAELVPVTLSGLEQIAAAPDADVVAVHEALQAFEAVDRRAAQVVELRFFAGLEVEEVADLLQLSPATVKRDWAFARAWLQRALSER